MMNETLCIAYTEWEQIFYNVVLPEVAGVLSKVFLVGLVVGFLLGLAVMYLWKR